MLLLERLEDGVHVEVTLGDGQRGAASLPLPPIVGGQVTAPLILSTPQVKTKAPSPKRLRRSSIKQENTLAKSHDGIRHYGSGNQPGYEGDVRAEGRYRIEAKLTTKSSYAITLKNLRKIRSECGLGEVPVFAVEFKDSKTLGTIDSWVLVPRSDWEKHVKTSDDQ